MIKTYKYRLYTNISQVNKLEITLNSQRNLYNQALEQRINIYKETGKGLNYFKQWSIFKTIRKTKYPFINCSSLQHLLRKLDKAYTSFFTRISQGTTAGFPRFKPSNRFHSFEYTYSDGCKLKKTNFYIQNVGDIKIKLHRPIPINSKIKHVVIKKSLRKWYACFMVELSNIIKQKSKEPEVGIDVGISPFLSFSDGRVIDSPKFFINSQKKLKKKQRSLSRKKKGSNRRKKQSFLVAKFHEKISNQRKDFIHKITKFVTDNYSNIYLEKMNLNFMTHNKHLAKHACDASIGMFRNMLGYKAEEAGNRVIYVKPHYTSQFCSQCGKITKKSLSVRTHKCSSCGYTADRNLNAALNILQLGTSCKDITYDNSQNVSLEADSFRGR